MIVDGRKGVLIKLSTSLGFSVDWRRVEVQVTAIHGGNGSLITLFTGFLSQPELFLDAKEPTFRDVLESWIPMHVESLTTCLMLDIWVFLENGTVLETRPPIGIPIQPIKVLEELVWKDAIIDPNNMVKGYIPQQSSGQAEPLNGGCHWEIEWMGISSYCYSSGWTDVPILIVTNPYPNSVINWGITLGITHESTFRITFSYGISIIDNAPYVNLTTYNGEVWSISEKYYFYQGNNIIPEGSHWIYIRARFTHVHERKWRVFICAGVVMKEEPTNEERIREYIYSIQLNGNTIVGGQKSGLPSQSIMNWFYNGTKEEVLSISGTPLSDGDLDVGEAIAFPQIFNCYDQYNEDFEIGIPIGAMVGAFTGLPTAYLGLISGLAASLCWGQSYTLDINGGLVNLGADSGYGYDIYEMIYMRISKYRYTSDTGYTYKVPAGIYFRCV